MSWKPGFCDNKKSATRKHGKALKQAEMAELQKEVQVVIFLVVAKGGVGGWM